jgi:hypothetical protein
MEQHRHPLGRERNSVVLSDAEEERVMDDAEEAGRSVRAAPRAFGKVNKPSISVVSPKSRWVHACYPSETVLPDTSARDAYHSCRPRSCTHDSL